MVDEGDQVGSHVDVGWGRDAFAGTRTLFQFGEREVHAGVVGAIDLIAQILLGRIPLGLDRIVPARRDFRRLRRAPAALDAVIGIERH